MSSLNRRCVLLVGIAAMALILIDAAVLGVGPREVIAWEDAGFSGRHMSWTLEPGMRQRLIPDIPEWFNDEISSFQVGSEVRVAAYRHSAFAGPYVVYSSDTGGVSNYWNDEISSVIVFPKEQAYPLGVVLSDTAFNTVTGYEPTRQFFPLPESLEQSEALYPSLGDYMNDEAQYVLVQGSTLEVELYKDADFGGWPTLTLPTSTLCSPETSYEHNGFPYYKLHGCTGDLDGAVSSLKVRWLGSGEKKETSTTPAIGSFTATVIQPVPDIRGTWNSTFGLTYEITQDGSAFTWHVVQFSEVGEGAISGTEIGVTWQGANGSGHDTGVIILDDGQATRIEWSHGNIFYR
jgi:hypothetical protein